MSCASQNQLNCVVIDDDPRICGLIANFLKKRGHRVFSFPSAPDALSQLVACQPDIILVDWMMPQMDGITFLAELDRHTVKYRPVTIMVSAINDDSAIQQAVHQGFDDFIRKPFTLSLLGMRLDVAEKQARTRRQLLELQKQHHEQESYLRMLSRNICAGILLIDLNNHHILYCNHFAAELIGRPLDDIIGKVCNNFICPREQGACPISDLRMPLNRRQAVLLTASGSERTILKTAEITTFHGVPAILETFVDINELLHVQSEMREFTHTMSQLVEARALQFQTRLREDLPEDEANKLAQEIGGCLFCAESNVRLVDHYWNLARDLIILPEGVSDLTRERYRAVVRGMDEALCAVGNSLGRSNEIFRWEAADEERAPLNAD